MRWSIVLMLSATLAGASAPLISATSEDNLSLNSSLASNTNSFDPLIYSPIDLRIAKLETQAKTPSSSNDAESMRARLVLADIYLNNRKAREAIATLDRLEENYPVLADYILLKRAQAQTQLRDLQAAKTTWESLLAKFPNSPATAEALFALGQNQQLLQKFPAHARSQEVVLRLLAQDPNRVDLMAHLATYFSDYKEIVPILNRLVASSPALTTDQWWAVADAYYYNFEFGRAANAYSRATPNPITAYNYARSLHRGKQFDAAIAAYNRVVQQFPQSPQAPRALIRITQIDSPEEALAATDRIIASYPDTAGEALALKATILQDKLDSPKAASGARNLLLEKYGNSEAAADLRWRIAKGQAQGGQTPKAIASVEALIANSPDSKSAAEASFWAGKWANQTGDKAKAKRFFEFTIRQHPDSYYAWRAASSLGWQVGTFTTARYTTPKIALPSARQSLPVGSAKLQELYILGLDRDARSQWRSEIAGKRNLEPKEIFNDGVLRVANQDNLIGIKTLESLDWIDVPQSQKADIAQLKQHPAYMKSLYPFHYWDLISNWANDRKLSPALVIGLVRQESRFEAQIRSRSGAIGLMQIMPDTGSWIASKKGINNYNLDNPEDNISFGTWYLDYTHSRYGDNSMLAVASYNAGPGAVGRWVESRGIGDPDDFVNSIPYDETRDYVSKVLGNYWNYLRLYSPSVQQQISALQQANNLNASSKF
ncbi:transglycosylase SLT domain-containing protein [Pseudanabaena sp. UWO310]|uniref:lytic transglycosylase domain-containing protein n=1 Tax=Pseudanabaena sp. UWO310 TaxID=2480795 RepID=UPI001157BF46|nr:transglycosylase SLT domain-containing protein [Pseudanabaena sp. UWO310]TYQ27309.1 transglycosylase SLT domain-containing protein [Pseudanabaena sp. UWO310]